MVNQIVSQKYYDRMKENILLQRPGECFGCRANVLNLRKVFYFNQPIWVCGNCEKTVKQWERELKSRKKVR